MTIQEVIEKAIEGGWEMPNWFESLYFKTDKIISTATADELLDRYTLLDLKFWQALGKNMGWEEHRCVIDTHPEVCGKCWSSYWHRLIDHLSEGKSIEEFFKHLV